MECQQHNLYILFCIVISVTIVHGHSHTVEKSYEAIKLVSVVFVCHAIVAVVMSFLKIIHVITNIFIVRS